MSEKDETVKPSLLPEDTVGDTVEYKDEDLEYFKKLDGPILEHLWPDPSPEWQENETTTVTFTSTTVAPATEPHDIEIYEDPIKYKIKQSVDVLLGLTEKGRLEDEETRSYLKHIAETQSVVIEYQKKLMDSQAEILESTKEESARLSAKIDHLQSELSKAEQRLKEVMLLV